MLGERTRVERSTADQRAVDVGLGEEHRGVLGLHRAAVQDAHGCWPRRAEQGAHRGADRARDVVGLLGRGVRPVPMAQMGS